MANTVSESISEVIEESRMPASLNIEVIFKASSLSVLWSLSEDLIKKMTLTNYAPPINPTKTIKQKSTYIFLQKKMDALRTKNVKRQDCAIVIIQTFLILTKERELREMKTPTW